jgi:hypothetical protein
LAWLKDSPRNFCEADEIIFYLICGKWGKPTRSQGKLNWKGEATSSAMGLQATLCKKDALHPFMDKLRLFL